MALIQTLAKKLISPRLQRTWGAFRSEPVDFIRTQITDELNCFSQVTQFGDQELKYGFVPGQNPHTTLTYITGFNAGVGAYDHWMQERAKDGFNIFTVQLPEVSSNSGFMDIFEQTITDFLTDSRSPLFKLVDPNIPRITGAHSSGGLAMQRLLHSQSFRQDIEETQTAIISMAPMMQAIGCNTTAGGKLYKWHASKNKDAICGSLRTDRAFCAWKEAGNMADADEHFTSPPTHGQVLSLIEAGEDLRKQGLAELSRVKQALFIGARDPFVCRTTAKTLFERASHPIIEIDAGHNPCMDTRDKDLLRSLFRGDFAVASEIALRSAVPAVVGNTQALEATVH